ncbi:MAG: F0F1 ATP synthase subunit C [Myxococcales bacterium]|nr:F0F1 ATP synthase subunit C [Myxococcales bacterium]
MQFKRFMASAIAFGVSMLAFAATAFAADGGGDNENTTKSMAALAIGIGLGIAAAGCGVGQGTAAAAALEGIGRNPGAAKELQGPLLLSLAFIESLAIYSLVISFILLGKL